MLVKYSLSPASEWQKSNTSLSQGGLGSAPLLSWRTGPLPCHNPDCCRSAPAWKRPVRSWGLPWSPPRIASALAGSFLAAEARPLVVVAQRSHGLRSGLEGAGFHLLKARHPEAQVSGGWTRPGDRLHPKFLFRWGIRSSEGKSAVILDVLQSGVNADLIAKLHVLAPNHAVDFAGISHAANRCGIEHSRGGNSQETAVLPAKLPRRPERREPPLVLAPVPANLRSGN